MTRAELRKCPKCGQRWPRDAEHHLRGMGWIYDLPRRVTPSNLDAIFHDGGYGRNRFLVFELKGPGEQIQVGQEWVLRALAGIERFTVAVLRDGAEGLSIERMTSEGLSGRRLSTAKDDVRLAVARWLSGEPFAVAPRRASPLAVPAVTDHCFTCGRAPDFRYADGSPGYRCSHASEVPA